MDRHAGFTLLELIFSMLIVVGLLAWGVPDFRALRLNAERTQQVNEFMQAIYLARSEAIKRNGVVSLCPSADGFACGPTGTPWHTGWIVFVNLDRDSPAVRDPGEQLLRVYAPWLTGKVIANRSTLSFRPFGQSGVTATFTFCDERDDGEARAVIISQTGRPRASQRSASGRPLRCI